MSSGEDTVSLNLDAGGFVSSATGAAAAGDKLGEALDKVGASAAKASGWSGADWLRVMEKGAEQAAKKLELAAKAADKLIAKNDKLAANRFNDKLGAFLAGSKTPDALIPKTSTAVDPLKNAMGAIFGGVGKLFGPQAAVGLRDGASKLAEVSDKLAPFGPLLSAGSGLLSSAGGVVMGAAGGILKAAAALAAAGVAVAAVGFKFAVEKTSEKEIQSAILGKLGAKNGFPLALKIAGDFGLDEGDALQKVKGLLGAKFKEAEIPALVRIAVGIGAVKGEDKAKAFLEKLETQQNKGGKASEETVKGFAEAGVDAEGVYKSLAAKLGISVDAAKAKVKAGTVDMKDALAAVKDSAGKDFGGIADQLGGGVFAQVNKLKIAVGQLFTGVDLGPLQEFLTTLNSAVAGPGGAAIKSGIKDLFGAISHALFDPFKGAEGQKKLERLLTTLGRSLTLWANVINDAAPHIAKLIDLLDDLFGAKGESGGGPAQKVDDLSTALVGLQGLDPLGALGGIFDALFGSGAEQGAEGGNALGVAITDGLTNAIASGAGGAISSVVSMVQGIITAARGAADAHSPSRKMGRLATDMSDGLTDKLDAANDNATRAGADLAGAAVGGAAGAGGGGALGAGGGGGGGAPPVTIIVQISGAVPNAQAVGQQAGAAAAEEWRRQMRAYQREGGERAGG